MREEVKECIQNFCGEVFRKSPFKETEEMGG
jgi:hypothetical protein